MAYRINPGDTLSALAARFKTTVDSLMKSNPQISNKNLIISGASLNGVGSDSFSAGGAPASAPSGAPNISGSGEVPPGKVGDWIKQAMDILKASGVDPSKMDPQAIATIIQHESGGNPTIQNNWDSNAAAGHPSIGLMQCIQPTFDSYKLPGHDDIRNPIDNIIAGVRYSISRYGSVSNVPGIQGLARGSGYVGY